jgi:predicted type IV restriction endonuclease
MLNADDALATFQVIMTEFSAFADASGAVTEADTRAKLIDRILKEVCGWPEAGVTRETHVDRGYVDYILTEAGRKLIAVEAKREGLPFVLPAGLTHRQYKLDGALVTDREVGNAINQVRGYCDDGGIRYAIATNGYAWIIFRAVREDMPWRKGTAIVFRSFSDIENNFTAFWNLLSYEAIARGSLHEEFGNRLRVSRNLHRVITRLFNADLPLRRNRLNTALQPLIKLIFENIADQHQLEILQSCYVHSNTVRLASEYLHNLITEPIPQFLHEEGTLSIGIPGAPKGFEHALRTAAVDRKGELVLLLGSIGSGKTTFLKRYLRTTGLDVLEKLTLWFPIDFLKAPLDPTQLEPFFWNSILNDIRTRYSARDFEKRRHLADVFGLEIEALRSTVLADLSKGTRAYDQALAPFLLEWQQQTSTYVPKLISTTSRREKVTPFFFIDNVDQLAAAYQAQIFLLAQRVTRMVDSVTVVCLREESYYTASVQKSFTAYSTRKFHIASPLFLKLIGNRIDYATKLLATSSAPISRNAASDDEDIRNYLLIVKDSLFSKNKRIARMIDTICYGNMRLALDLFSTFLTSGATDVGKMLRIWERDGNYHVAYHEFVKSIMLGDRKYYKEDQSPVLNVFNVGAEQNSSHFTALRVLRVLLAFRGDSNPEGRGYVEVSNLVNEFENTFDNREDLVSALTRLVRKQLIEVNTRSTDNLEGASHIRITSGGWYYLRYLSRTFAYLDLVLQDTPFDDPHLEKDLRESVLKVDNLDKEDSRLERIRVRFERVRRFLAYLEAQENAERTRYQLNAVHGPIGALTMPLIIRQFDSDAAWIEHRLLENREKYEEDSIEVQPVEDVEVLELFDELQRSTDDST